MKELRNSIRNYIWGKSRKYPENQIATAIADIAHYRSNTFDRKLITMLNRLPEYKWKRMKALVNEKLAKE